MVQTAIFELCSIQEMSCKEIAALLDRTEDTIQNHYLNKMCDGGELITKYPVKHHPKQRYTAKQRS
jgi:transposase